MRKREKDDEAGMSETRWEPVKRPHENICQFAQCKQAVTMCLGVSGSNPWIMHQLARGYCSAQPVKGRAECEHECVAEGRKEALRPSG